MEGKVVKEIQAKMKTWTDAGIELAYNSGYEQGCKDRDEIYAEDMEGKWIPVSERLPEDGKSVLFCDIDEDIMIGYHIKGRPVTHFSQDGTYEDMKNVIAWMPLPEPYKESEEWGSDDIQ